MVAMRGPQVASRMVELLSPYATEDIVQPVLQVMPALVGASTYYVKDEDLKRAHEVVLAP